MSLTNKLAFSDAKLTYSKGPRMDAAAEPLNPTAAPSPSMAAAPRALSAPPSAAASNPGKRKRPSKGKGSKGKKKKLARSEEPVRRRTNKPSAKFLKLLQKRARDYNSDDDEHRQQQEEEAPGPRRHDDRDDDDETLSGDDEEEAASSSEDEAAAAAGGVTRFEQGCRAFRAAFQKIMAKKLPDDPLVRSLLLFLEFPPSIDDACREKK
jgi:hypothetical protein